MNGVIAILLMVASVNPVRRRSELPPDRSQVAVGAALAFVALVALGLVGGSLLDGLDITVPTFRVAVALVLFVVAVKDLFTGLPEGGPVRPGRAGAVAPVFFPVLLRPEAALAAVLVGTDAATGWLAVGAALALLDPVFWSDRTRNARMDRALGAAISIAAVVLAVDLLVDGVFAL